jgi:outer membrane immunogenic protein
MWHCESLTMRKLLLASTAIAMLSAVGAASAADLPTRKGPPIAPVYVPPVFTWTGFYVGANAGYGWRNNNNNDGGFLPLNAVIVGGGGFFPVSSGGGSGGFLGGVQAGYNYQFSPGAGFVVGAEADIDWANFGRNNSNNGALFTSFSLPQFPGTTFSPSGLAVSTHSNNNQWFGTLRLRAGYAWDRFLVYGTGGLAYGSIRNNGNGFGGGFIATTTAGFTNPVSGVAGPSTAFIGGATSGGSSSRAGWTLGVGAEYAITYNWTVKAEYLYANFGSVKTGGGFLFPGAAIALNHSRDLDVNVIRLGVNYKFW